MPKLKERGNAMRNGRLITIEGINTNDRTTHLHNLAQYLIDAGQTVLDLPEPLGAKAARHRKAIAVQNAAIIDTAIKGGCIVLAEGFFDGDVTWHDQLPDIAFPKLTPNKKPAQVRINPDLSFVLESDLAVAWGECREWGAKTNDVRDWINSPTFCEKAEARWMEMIAQADWPVYLIPAAQSAAIIQRQMIRHTNQLLDRSGRPTFSYPTQQPATRRATPRLIKLPQQATV
jgi:thymidylate kinase